MPAATPPISTRSPAARRARRHRLAHQRAVATTSTKSPASSLRSAAGGTARPAPSATTTRAVGTGRRAAPCPVEDLDEDQDRARAALRRRADAGDARLEVALAEALDLHRAAMSTRRRTTSAAGIWAATSTRQVSSKVTILPSIGSDSPGLARRSPITPSKGATTTASASSLRATSSWASATAICAFLARPRRWPGRAPERATMRAGERLLVGAVLLGPFRVGARSFERGHALVDPRLELDGLESRQYLALLTRSPSRTSTSARRPGCATSRSSGRPAGSSR